MNVIILLVDTLRADHVGCYGYSRDTSPHLDAFAEGATRFENVTSQAPWTNPSVASLLSSLYPSTHHLVTFKDGEQVRRLAESVTTLGEVLEGVGYHTAAFTSNPWISPSTGLDQGFTVFRKLPLLETGEGAPAPELNQAAMEWLNALNEEPFFLFVHYMDVHGPYLPPEPYREMFTDPKKRKRPLFDVFKRRIPPYLLIPGLETLDDYLDRYDGQIRFWDDHFAEFIEGLENGGFLDNTMVVVTSDHGEEFLEHGGFNHGATLYEEQIRVPLVWKLPDGHLEAPVVTAEVELVDVMPTVLALANIEAGIELQGDDLSPLIANDRWESKPAFSEATVALGGVPHPAGVVKAIRFDGIKTIVNLDNDEALAFDLAANPGEDLSVARSADLPTDAGKTAIDEWISINTALGARFLPTFTDIDPTLADQLKALGYVER